jgi:hypothetical protein
VTLIAGPLVVARAAREVMVTVLDDPGDATALPLDDPADIVRTARSAEGTGRTRDLSRWYAEASDWRDTALSDPVSRPDAPFTSDRPGRSAGRADARPLGGFGTDPAPRSDVPAPPPSFPERGAGSRDVPGAGEFGDDPPIDPTLDLGGPEDPR